MAFTSRKIALIKKQFLPDKTFASTSWMMDMLKNVFLLNGKVATTLQNLKISENIEKTGVH